MAGGINGDGWKDRWISKFTNAASKQSRSPLHRHRQWNNVWYELEAQMDRMKEF